MNINTIEAGDIVGINFNNAGYTLTRAAEVLYIPVATGDSWIFKDLDCNPPKIHYISEGCTITLMEKASGKDS